MERGKGENGARRNALEVKEGVEEKNKTNHCQNRRKNSGLKWPGLPGGGEGKCGRGLGKQNETNEEKSGHGVRQSRT